MSLRGMAHCPLDGSTTAYNQPTVARQKGFGVGIEKGGAWCGFFPPIGSRFWEGLCPPYKMFWFFGQNGALLVHFAHCFHRATLCNVYT